MFEDLENNSAEYVTSMPLERTCYYFEMNVKWLASIKPEVMPPFLK
jgi:hypothetical protein